LAAAAPGDRLSLSAGRHEGPIVVDRALTLEGQPGAVLHGGGTGRVVTIDAPQGVLRGMTVTGSGRDLAVEDSGIFVTARAAGAMIEDNLIEGNLIGVNLKGPKAAIVRHNRIEGRHDVQMSERGNGVSIWNSPGSVVEANEISFGRDGIFVITSRDNVFRDNRFRDLRFAIHYMYANKGTVTGNDSAGNHVGYALMYSAGLTVDRNRSAGDRDHGLLLNYANGARIEGNAVVAGGEKCVFIYNSTKNIFRGNWFEGCQIGIHLTAGSERNAIAGNAFLGNRTQVKYVGTRFQEWSDQGRGNYWSDDPAFDLNGDGLADQPYRPNDLIDQVVWSHPLAKLLLNSPAVQTVRFAQARFPALLPGGIVDSAPLMAPPLVPASMAPEPAG
ncbi:MAG TPA: nitrous oxide reductase family maturation protein NosD, partial [Candidatus Limnocylindria bacterium]|nr:nitrous oxide reductase family maturation protein NosD [Candidatus Limnocylindria bacterium]